MDPGDDTDQRSADFGRDLLICVNRERGSGIAGKRMTQTGGPNGRASWSERVNLWMKKSSSVSFVILCEFHGLAKPISIGALGVGVQKGKFLTDERPPHAACSASSTELAANFPNHLLKMASSKGDKRFTSALTS